MEIERKFLVERLPDLGDAEPAEIAQGYLAVDDDVEVRVRRTGASWRLTVKRGSGQTRDEVEVEVPAEDGEQLWSMTAGRRLSKLRYRLEAEAGEIEIDVYSGELEGLTVAEIEFADEQAAARFDPPPWLGRELTGEQRWSNRALAGSGVPEEGDR
jgi:CYTH domain-containing protein